ncbi:DUF1707 domain-containing protein [Planosporangium sp. 12N6]|uniref:DUF1707 SHOCT-like domain-containing protein n=1 Tax=Planosporangium spinosum TaxID=3402278 RepID=UPI003CF5C7E6
MAENLPERADPRQLRASDADRERVADVLRRAAAEGRLTLDELGERLAVVYAAKSYAELEPVTSDLPAAPLAGPGPAHDVRPVDGERVPGTAVAIMSGFHRAGRWPVPRRFTSLAFWGGGKIDLREARFLEGAVRIRAFAVMGGIEIVVPEEAEVHVTGVGIMGGFEHAADGPGVPGGPRVTVSGLAFWGGVSVRRRAGDEELRRRREERKRRKLERGKAAD